MRAPSFSSMSGTLLISRSSSSVGGPQQYQRLHST
jgi:hypothetical protein